MQNEVSDKLDLNAMEVKVLGHWDAIDAFTTSVKQSQEEGRPEYAFYDGPPFATGLPHYGHLLAGTIKDTVTRYAHMTGHYVSRRFGWDTHGLPVEHEIDKNLGIKSTDDVMKMGIPKYNAECRAIVMRYSEEWKKVVKRMGRWIDMDHPYKTMDLSFMESVWWVFKQLFEKGLVYRGFKVMPFSTACATPLSNFEAGLDYRDVSDPAVFVTFPLVEDPKTSFIAWTTTPWTLPSNLALCVNENFDYVKVYDHTTEHNYILLEAQLKDLPGGKGAKRDVIAKFKGKEIVGKKYIPLFDYFASEGEKGAFRVIADNYVTADSGTGIVHCAPAFGEDDYRVCVANGVTQKGDSIICPVDNNGRFTAEIKDFPGVYVKDADKDILKMLKEKKRIFSQGSIVHSYPFCWRSDTPLIYKAVSSWFVEVEKIKDKLLVNNKKSYWVPEFVQEKRFHNWLEGAHDWAISRNRFWGTPLPIWANADFSEVVIVGSVEELHQLSGVKVNDLHRETVDDLKIPSKKNPGTFLSRVPEVFDCWFESGSMPYAQLHYPFENKERFEKTFPADFIAEGIDQTRGWFYTLLVIATALFDKPPFKNLIVNGLVLASDGKKMSKRLKNYPDPMLVTDKYGADALRLYLINSPVVRGDTLRFNEKGVKDLLPLVFLPWYNAYRFFSQNVKSYQKTNGVAFVPNNEVILTKGNVMDKWITSITQSLVKFVRKEMALYHLYTVVPRLVDFISLLTNWYVRLNRSRVKGNQGQQEAQVSLSTLFNVLFSLCKTMAPFTPFFVEHVYQGLREFCPEKERVDSIHYLSFPQPWEAAINPQIEDAVSRMQAVIELGRTARDRRKLPTKHPLRSITVVHSDEKFLADLNTLKDYIILEMNVAELILTQEETKYIKVRVEPDKAALGKRLRQAANAVYTAVNDLTAAQIKSFQEKGKITLAGQELTSADIQVKREFSGDSKLFEATWEGEMVVILDVQMDASLRQKGLAREAVNKIQKARKKANLYPVDAIEVYYEVTPATGELAAALVAQKPYLTQALGVLPLPKPFLSKNASVFYHDEGPLKGSEEERIAVWLVCPQVVVDKTALQTQQIEEAVCENVELAVASMDVAKVKKALESNGGKLTLKVLGRAEPVVLTHGSTLFLSTAEKVQAKGL